MERSGNSQTWWSWQELNTFCTPLSHEALTFDLYCWLLVKNCSLPRNSLDKDSAQWLQYQRRKTYFYEFKHSSPKLQNHIFPHFLPLDNLQMTAFIGTTSSVESSSMWGPPLERDDCSSFCAELETEHFKILTNKIKLHHRKNVCWHFGGLTL